MPPTSKKRKTNNPKLKQKKLLKVRLIKISMVIEDYLYKSKPVSTSEARAYVEEVSNYKLQCDGDARSLQVIEKITRCMNSIIAEQQEDRIDCIDFHQVSENYCPSPVYSTVDEDETIVEETHPNNTDILEKDNNETIDLCDDENDDHRNINVEVEIHRAMSNLSIRENDHATNLNMNIIDYSQSILNELNENRAKEIKQMVPVKTPQKSLQKHNLLINCNEPEFDTECSQSVLADFNQQNIQLIENSTTIKHIPEANNQVSKKLIEIPNKENDLGNNNQKLKKQIGKMVKSYDKIETIEPEKNKNNHLQKRQRKNKSSIKKDKVIKRKKTTNALNTKASDGPVNTFSNIANKITTKADAPLPNVNETIYQNTQSANICEINKSSFYNKSMGKIYNKNVENDLSWVENIRYVREISMEEFDPKYGSVADSFWTNFALPNDWNEKDFDYFD